MLPEYLSNISAEPSVDPSSTTMTSLSGWSCESAESTVAQMKSRWLQHVITMLNRILFAIGLPRSMGGSRLQVRVSSIAEPRGELQWQAGPNGVREFMDHAFRIRFRRLRRL